MSTHATRGASSVTPAVASSSSSSSSRRRASSHRATTTTPRVCGGDTTTDANQRKPSKTSSSSLITRRALLAGVATAAPAADAAVRWTADGLDPDRAFFHAFPPIWEPYFGWGERRTVTRPIVDGIIWSLEQEQALDVLAMNVRTTVVKLAADGSLVVFSPQAPTGEFFRAIDALGPVSHVVLPTYALEHKVYLPAFCRRYPNARVWVADGIWSVPIDLPLPLLGIDPSSGGVLKRAEDRGADDVAPPWADEIDYKVLRVDSAGANPYVEAVFLHAASKTLIVTDLVLSIPATPPEVISRERLLNLAPNDPADAPAADTEENLKIGWAKASLVVSFLGPSRQSQIKGGAYDGKLKWEPGFEASFEKISDRLIPSPILRTLVFSKGKGPTRRFVNEVCDDWGGEFETIAPAHYDAPVRGDCASLRAAFAFIDDPGEDGLGLTTPGAELPAEDMGVLLQVNDVLEKIGLGKGTEL
jgi:hypothetical protein